MDSSLTPASSPAPADELAQLRQRLAEAEAALARKDAARKALEQRARDLLQGVDAKWRAEIEALREAQRARDSALEAEAASLRERADAEAEAATHYESKKMFAPSTSRSSQWRRICSSRFLSPCRMARKTPSSHCLACSALVLFRATMASESCPLLHRPAVQG